MNNRLSLLIGLTLTATLLGINVPTAQAQLGIGIGAGNGYRGGLGLWGAGYGSGGGGGFYGMGFSLSPGRYTNQLPKNELSNAAAKKNLSQNNAGSLDGYVKLCAPSPGAEKVNTSAKTANKMCPPSTETMQDVAIVASPYGLNQWIGTKPDASGHYHLLLMPGGYLVQPSTPSIQNQRPLEVIIEPNQTTHQDFQIGP